MSWWTKAEGNTPTQPMLEIDYRALRLMLERSSGPEILKQKHIKRFDRAWKGGHLFYCREETGLQKWMRCESRFTLGDYSDWSGWQYRDKWSEKIWFSNPFKTPVWRVDKVNTLYIVGEQGLGDEVLLSQCVEDCKKFANEVVFETQDRLQSVFERSLGCKTKKAIVGADLIRRAQPFTADAWVSLGELPRLFRKKRDDFIRTPYIKVDPSRVEEMKPYEGMTGLSWRGAQGTIDWRKLKSMHPEGISLQYDQDDEDIKKPHIDLKNDIEGVLALLSVLGKMVTCSTTAAHFAAASGVSLDLIIADPKTGIRNNIMPWRWLDLSCKKIPRQSIWYGDHVRVWQNLGQYAAYRN